MLPKSQKSIFLNWNFCLGPYKKCLNNVIDHNIKAEKVRQILGNEHIVFPWFGDNSLNYYTRNKLYQTLIILDWYNFRVEKRSIKENEITEQKLTNYFEQVKRFHSLIGNIDMNPDHIIFIKHQIELYQYLIKKSRKNPLTYEYFDKIEERYNVYGISSLPNSKYNQLKRLRNYLNYPLSIPILYYTLEENEWTKEGKWAVQGKQLAYLITFLKKKELFLYYDIGKKVKEAELFIEAFNPNAKTTRNLTKFMADDIPKESENFLLKIFGSILSKRQSA